MPEYKLGKFVFKGVNASEKYKEGTFVIARQDELKDAAEYSNNIYVKNF